MEQKPKRTRIYSRRGDLGETSLLFGPRVGKDHRRIELLGVLDELNAQLGCARSLEIDSSVNSVLKRVQLALYLVCVEVSTIEPAKLQVRRIRDEDVKAVERAIDFWDVKLEPTRVFILPSGSRASTAINLARAVCRRAERRACALLRFDSSFSPKVGAWLNRVGDLLFVLARYENFRLDIPEEKISDFSEVVEFI